MSATQLTRVFKLGSVTLPDPDPSMPVERVKDLYSVNYPHLASAVIENPVVSGALITYGFTPAPVKTKG